MLRPALQFTAYIEVGLVTAIDRAFTHWDLSHWHEFRLPDDRGIVMQNANEIEAAAQAAISVSGLTRASSIGRNRRLIAISASNRVRVGTNLKSSLQDMYVRNWAMTAGSDAFSFMTQSLRRPGCDMRPREPPVGARSFERRLRVCHRHHT
jgi:hypothetical protein